MTSEAVAFTGSGIIVIINIVGWWLASKREERARAAAIEVAEVVAKTELKNMELTVAKLPCVTNSDYMKESGILLEKVKQLEARQNESHQKLDTIISRLPIRNG